MGLVLTDYNALANKVPVQTAMLEQSFTNKDAIAAAFNTAVANQKIVETAA